MKRIILFSVCSMSISYGMIKKETVSKENEKKAIFNLFQMLEVPANETKLDSCIEKMIQDIDCCIKKGADVNTIEKSSTKKQTIIDRVQSILDLMSELSEDDENENYTYVYNRFIGEIKKRGGKSCKELEQFTDQYALFNLFYKLCTMDNCNEFLDIMKKDMQTCLGNGVDINTIVDNQTIKDVLQQEVYKFNAITPTELMAEPVKMNDYRSACYEFLQAIENAGGKSKKELDGTDNNKVDLLKVNDLPMVEGEIVDF